jgi:uncharacterized protein YutE (UPF0331/DUF86 family)
MDVNLGADVFNIKSSTVVKLSEYLSLVTVNGAIDLKVDITADFEKIPKEYHEVLLNMLTSKYINKVSFGDNPFSKCLPPKRKHWYQFWR